MREHYRPDSTSSIWLIGRVLICFAALVAIGAMAALGA